MSRRALTIGLFVAVLVNVWPTYSSLVVHSSRADYAHLSVAFLIPFVFLLGINLILDRFGHGLSPSEMLCICCIGMVSATMQGEWLAGYFLGVVTAPHYFATPENRWADLLFEHIPSWSIVASADAATGFYESLPKASPFPWGPWLPPLFWWSGFFGALLLASFSLVTIFRKQWMEHERLTFPVAAALLELTGVSGTRGALANLTRAPLFRVGFVLVLFAISWNILTWFSATLPTLPVLETRHVPIARGFPALRVIVHPMIIAFGYFTKSEVLLSIWVFHLLAILQIGIFDRTGFTIGGSDPWCSLDAAIGWQNFGGMIVFVGWGIWAARAHLKAVILQAFTRRNTVDDSGEIMSSRMSVFVFLGSAIYLFFFLHHAGMALGPLVAFWLGTFVLYLGLARIMVESGLVYLRGPITAQAFTWHLFGIAGMGPSSAAALGLSFTFFCDAKTFAITTLAHIPRLGTVMSARRRRLLVPAVIAGCFLGAIAAIGYTVHQGYYTSGSYNFGASSFNGSGDGAVGIWRLSANRIQQGTFGTDWERVQFLGIGMAFTALLYYLRYRLPAFPIHPIGFTMSASGFMRNGVVSIFLIWAVKTLLLRVGGLERYRKTAPLFLGILLGYLAGVGLGLIVDIIWFNGNGHLVNRP